MVSASVDRARRRLSGPEMVADGGMTVAAPFGLGATLPTETGVVVFQLATAVFGGAAALIAGRRLSTIEGSEIQVSDLAVPVAVAGVSTVIGAFLLPSG